MAEGFLDQMGVSFGENGFNISWVGNLIIVIFLLGLVGFAVYIYLNNKSYNKKLHVFRNINGRPTPVGVERAREITLPFTSTKAFQVKKGGFFLPRPSIETHKNNYWFMIRDDGEWVNIGLESFNDKLKAMNMFFDHGDMRMANAALKKLVERNYKKTNWIKEWAPFIGFGMIILMLGIGGYLFSKEMGSVLGGLQNSVVSQQETAAVYERILLGIDGAGGLLQPSSGLQDAG